MRHKNHPGTISTFKLVNDATRELAEAPFQRYFDAQP